MKTTLRLDLYNGNMFYCGNDMLAILMCQIKYCLLGDKRKFYCSLVFIQDYYSVRGYYSKHLQGYILLCVGGSKRKSVLYSS